MFFSMVVREQNFECMLVLDPPAAATIMTLLLCNDLARADESARTSSSSPTATPEVQTCIQFSTSNQCSMYTFLGETQFWFKRKKNHFFFFFRYSSLLPFWQVNIHPLELFSRGAFHGGSWRSPYARYPAVGRTATALGLLAPFRFSAALLES